MAAKKKGTRDRKKSSGKKSTKKEPAEEVIEEPEEEPVEEPEEELVEDPEEEPEELAVSDAVSEVLGKEKKERALPKKYSKLLLQWTADGYYVKELEELMETAGIKKIRAAFKNFEEAVLRIEEIKEALEEMILDGLEKEVKDLYGLLSDPNNYEEANAQFEILKKQKKSLMLKSELDKMVLPSLRDKVEKLEERLSDLDDLDALEKDLDVLKLEYKESYFVTGIISDVKPSAAKKPTAQPDTKQPIRAGTPMLVKDIFLLYKDGRFISHHTSRPVSKEEQTKLFADLKTGRNYLRSPKYVPHKLNTLPIEGRNLVIQSGNYSVVIMIVEGAVNPWTERIISKVLILMEKEDMAALHDWNGDVASLKSSGKYMQALLFACMKLAKKAKA